MCTCQGRIEAIKSGKAKSDIDLARLMAESENETYIVYEYDGKENFTSEKGWEAQGRPGEIKTIIHP